MLFTSPKVEDIVRLLIEKSKTVGVVKSDEQLLVEATAFVKKAYVEVLSLEEGEVVEETDFFESGGDSMKVRVLLDYIKSDQGQEKDLKQSIEQHELFASPTVMAVAAILVEKIKKGGKGDEASKKTIESLAEELMLDNEKYCELFCSVDVIPRLFARESFLILISPQLYVPFLINRPCFICPRTNVCIECLRSWCCL